MRFHPVVLMPDDAVVLDLSGDAPAAAPGPWAVGRYDELRPALYTQGLFAGGRCLHVGVDLGGPPGTPVHAFDDGEVAFLGVNPAPGDYGPTLITAHTLDGAPLWALHGHLSRASVERWRPGDRVEKGAVLGWIGGSHENGGWPPHVHFQLSRVRPTTHDLPGVVAPEERARALRDYPDPRLVLGALW
ncbi:MAG: peptidoglycan DD-metalloendopeptidase family protein [Alphaproteobacteria bacterium]|nr:peptidoglycan DD-metalloendopeptidase family protein [Alphaproteobacteria bacterium]